MTELTKEQQIEFEAAAFRTLVAHLRNRTDVQNIDLMNLSGFCRNCLSNWYQDAASESGVELSKAEARERVYGMPIRTGKKSTRPRPQRNRRQPSKETGLITERNGSLVRADSIRNPLDGSGLSMHL